MAVPAQYDQRHQQPVLFVVTVLPYARGCANCQSPVLLPMKGSDCNSSQVDVVAVVAKCSGSSSRRKISGFIVPTNKPILQRFVKAAIQLNDGPGTICTKAINNQIEEESQANCITLAQSQLNVGRAYVQNMTAT
eukprot:12320-Heterococcus_DN1.PRE.3